MANPRKAPRPGKAKLPTLRAKSERLLKFERDVIDKMSWDEFVNMGSEIEDRWELLRLERLGKVYDDNPRRRGESVKAYSNRLFLLNNK
jgi:hypothetical protein